MGLFTVVLFVTVSLNTYDKKITKIVSKIWKNEAVILNAINLPDSLSNEFSSLQAIKIKDSLVGYVCTATAFGCRVGGCAAPSNANVQSYETFDYIVVYNTEIDIIQVDIANYGGTYGYEICNQKWLKQFEGNNSNFVLGKNVDGITGATVSANFLIDDLNAIGPKLKNYLLIP